MEEQNYNKENCFVIGKRLSLSVIVLILVQFAAIIWFARGLETRLCNLENAWTKNEPAISRLDVIEFRQAKMSELLEKVRESQLTQEIILAELKTRPFKK